jgi:copper chaperone
MRSSSDTDGLADPLSICYLNDMTKTILRVEGMSCGHCKLSVEKALKAVSGVVKADVNLSGKSASVSYDETACTPERLKQAVADAGYQVI